MADPNIEAGAQEFAWLLDRLVRNTDGLVGAMAVSSDGFMLACTDSLPPDTADQFAAIISGLSSLTVGAARCFANHEVSRVVIEMDRNFILVARISDGSILGVVADKQSNIGMVGYEMTLFVDAAGRVLTPELVQELKNSLVA